MLQVQSLHIQALARKNDFDNALKLLRAYIADTRENEIIRLYTDLGIEMQYLLMKLTLNEKEDPYIKSILQSFGEIEKDPISADRPYSPKIIEVKTNNGIVKIRLSSSEIKLIFLLNAGLSNTEIAEKIHIASDSVKKALYRLYKKLNVNKRSDAIHKAVELEVIKET